MQQRIGLWIDHRKAVVAALADDGHETIVTIQSKVERHPGRSGARHAMTSRESQQASADDPENGAGGPREDA